MLCDESLTLKYSKILDIFQYNHRLCTTIIILLNLKNNRSKLQLLVKPVIGLSIPLPTLILNFNTKLIFIHLTI